MVHKKTTVGCFLFLLKARSTTSLPKWNSLPRFHSYLRLLGSEHISGWGLRADWAPWCPLSLLPRDCWRGDRHGAVLSGSFCLSLWVSDENIAWIDCELTLIFLSISFWGSFLLDSQSWFHFVKTNFLSVLNLSWVVSWIKQTLEEMKGDEILMLLIKLSFFYSFPKRNYRVNVNRRSKWLKLLCMQGFFGSNRNVLELNRDDRYATS